MKLFVSLACIFVIATAAGCGDNKPRSGNSSSSDKSAPTANVQATPTPPADPVKEFRTFAKIAMESAESLAKEHRFTVRGSGSGPVQLALKARYQIDFEYTIDVKKSDSLITPYVGVIKTRRRYVYDQLLGVKDAPDAWQPFEIECGYTDGKWEFAKDLKHQVMGEHLE